MKADSSRPSQYSYQRSVSSAVNNLRYAQKYEPWVDKDNIRNIERARDDIKSVLSSGKSSDKKIADDPSTRDRVLRDLYTVRDSIRSGYRNRSGKRLENKTSLVIIFISSLILGFFGFFRNFNTGKFISVSGYNFQIILIFLATALILTYFMFKRSRK